MSIETAFTIADIGGARKRESGTAWRINAASNDISGCEILVDAPGSGAHIYIERISIIFAAGILVSVGGGESASKVETVKLGPFVYEQHFDFSYDPIQLPDNKAFTADASEAGLVCIVAEGFTI